MKFSSMSESETEEIGYKLGTEANAFDVYCLKGELGAGKTVFVRGFARGLGYVGAVTSPTFTLVNEYEGGRLPLFHFDLYRIHEPVDLESIGWDDYVNGSGVVIVEWPERAGGLLPKEHVLIEIMYTGAPGREICINENTCD